MNSLKFFLLIGMCCAIISCNSESGGTTSNTKQKQPETTGSKIIETSNGKYHSFNAGAKPYKMSIPIDWIVKEHAKSGSVATKAPTKETKKFFAEMIEVNIRQARRVYSEEKKKMEVQPISLKENIDNYLEGLKRAYKEMQVESIEEVKIGGKDAIVGTYTYLHQPEFSGKLKAQTYISQYEFDNYILTFKAMENQFDAKQPIFEDVKNSFEFE